MIQQEFVSAPIVDTGSESVRFAVVVGGLVIRALVSREFLEDRFLAGPRPSDWLAAYESHRQELHQMVSRMYLREGISPRAHPHR
jgi:hypothetical protein